MNLQELNKKIIDLEKGYKELSYWHDKNKILTFDTHLANKKVHEELIKNQKRQTDFQEQLVNSLNQTMQAIMEINDRLSKLEDKR